MLLRVELVLALLGLCVIAALFVGAGRAQGQESAVKRLLSDEATTILQAQEELLAARTDLISQLISVVDSQQNHETRRESVRASMFILGEMRATQAVPVLVKYIAFRDDPSARFAQPHRFGSGPLEQEGPAVQALVKIGEPCLKAVINKLATTYDVTEQKCCIRVLIELRESDAASAMLVDAIAEEADLKKRERLHNSLDMLLRIE